MDVVVEISLRCQCARLEIVKSDFLILIRLADVHIPFMCFKIEIGQASAD